MALPPVYLDACVNHYLVEALRERGFTVTAALEEAQEDEPDNVQLAYATRRGRVLITHNGKHFWVMHVVALELGQPHAPIIVLPETSNLERLALRATMLCTWRPSLAAEPFAFLKWGQLQQWLQASNRLPGYTEADVQLTLGR